jgi:hypothetical protein
MKKGWIFGINAAVVFFGACHVRDEIATRRDADVTVNMESGGAGGLGGAPIAGGMGGTGGMGGDTIDVLDHWYDGVAYYVFVDRFANGDTSNDGVPIAGVPMAANYHGGDWQGVINKIKEGYFGASLGSIRSGSSAACRQHRNVWLWARMAKITARIMGIGRKTFYKAEERLRYNGQAEGSRRRGAQSRTLRCLSIMPRTTYMNSALVYSQQHPGVVFAEFQWSRAETAFAVTGAAWEGGATEKCWFTP